MKKNLYCPKANALLSDENLLIATYHHQLLIIVVKN